MLPIEELPPISDEIVQTEYQRAISSPRLFLRETVDRLAEYRPYPLYSTLIDGVRTIADAGSYGSLLHLRQTLFIPACFDRAAREAGLPPIRVTRATMNAVYGELQLLTIDEASVSNGDLEKRIRIFSDPLAQALDHFTGLAELDQLEEKVIASASKKSLRAFQLYERQLGEPTTTIEEDFGSVRVEGPNESMPLISSSVVDRAMLEIIIDPGKLLDGFYEFTSSGNHGLGAYMIGGSAILGSEYTLLGSFINFAVQNEFRKRSLPVPQVRRDILDAFGQESIKEARGDGEETTNINENITKIFKENRDLMEEENPYLFGAIKLLEDVMHINRNKVNHAILHFYRAWRNQITTDFWARKITT